MYVLYSSIMPSQPTPPKSPDSLSVKLGGWFEAHATGRGVLAIPAIVVLLVLAAVFKVAFS